MIQEVLSLVDRASAEIMEVYRSDDFDAQLKGDNSPVTKADLLASELLIAGLSKLSGLPVVSEEAPLDYVERKNFSRFWLVDPLDGTKDFLERDDEFTVNVALIDGTQCVLGVVAAPALAVTYFAERGKGAFRRTADGTRSVRYATDRTERVCADSRFHSSDALKSFCEQNGIASVVKSGSAIKMCHLAEGKVDVYPRFGTTMEWDVAASQCIAEEAGCEVWGLKTKKPLRYNKEDMRVDGFIAFPRGSKFIW